MSHGRFVSARLDALLALKDDYPNWQIFWAPRGPTMDRRPGFRASLQWVHNVRCELWAEDLEVLRQVLAGTDAALPRRAGGDG